MEFTIPYQPEHERSTATGPVNFDALGEVIDGYAPGWHPVAPADDVVQLQAFVRFQHQVLMEINELTSDWSTPDVLDLIQIKVRTALRLAEKSGLLK